MPVASIVSKRTYLSRESVVGTRQPPNLFLEGLNIRVTPNSTRGEVRPAGSTMRTARPLIQDWSTFTLADGSYLDYQSALYWLSALLGVPVTTTPGGGTLSREHAFTYGSDGLNTRPSFTFATGYRGGTAEETVRNIFQSVNFGFSRTAAPTLGGSGYGRNIDLGASLGVNEIQTVTIGGSPSAGTFTLTYAGQTTAAIAFDAANATVQTELLALSNLAPGDVVVTGPAGGPYILTFGGTLANTDVALLTGDASSLTQAGDAALSINTTVQGNGTTNEEQTVTISPAATGGTFTLTFNGNTTNAIAFNATNATMDTQLEALNSIGAGQVAVAGSAGGPWTITFGGTLANTNVNTITGSAANLTQAGDPTITIAQTQAGGITTIPVRAVQAPEWDVYADATVGAIGTTKLAPSVAGGVYSGEFTFSGLVNPDWVIDSSLESYSDDVLQVPELSLNLVMRNDATARALYTALLAGATYWIRYQAIGPIIEGALHYELRLDMAVQASENIGQFGDEGGSETMPFPLTIVSDSTFASGGFSALLRNTVATL